MKKHRRSKRWDTKQQAEKKWTSSKIWISLFFVAILVISTIGYFSSNVDSVYSIKYNGTVIFQDPETFEWYIEQDGKTVYFSNPPDALQEFNVLELIKTQRLFYGSYDPDNEFRQTFSKIEYGLEQQYLKDRNSYFVYAFNESNAYGKPIVDCRNATNTSPVIFFMEAELGTPSSITLDNNCILFQSNTEAGFMLLRDKLMYKLYGIY